MVFCASYRYNNFQHDDLSKCNCTPPYSARLAIAARADLNDMNGTYPDEALGFGCGGSTDTKVRIKLYHKLSLSFFFLQISSYQLMQQFSLVAIAGPTADQQKPFVWSQSYCDKEVPHYGQPDTWNFDPITPTWKLS